MRGSRAGWVAAAAAAAGWLGGADVARAQNGTLQAAFANFPPMTVGVNTEPVRGPVALRACPAPGSQVQTKGGPDFVFNGASDRNPDLCRVTIGGEPVEAWYGIWVTSWPGADLAYPAMTRAMRGGIGTVEGFDAVAAPGYAYHDLIRNEGVEDIRILGVTYRALRLAHYREGFNGNIYRSVSTIWKDTATGLLIYGTYQHISGAPVIDDPLIPTAIIPAGR